MHMAAHEYLDTERFPCALCKDSLHASDFPEHGEFPLAEKLLQPMLSQAFGNIDADEPAICNDCADALEKCPHCGDIGQHDQMRTSEFTGEHVCADCQQDYDAEIRQETADENDKWACLRAAQGGA